VDNPVTPDFLKPVSIYRQETVYGEGEVGRIVLSVRHTHPLFGDQVAMDTLWDRIPNGGDPGIKNCVPVSIDVEALIRAAVCLKSLGKEHVIGPSMTAEKMATFCAYLAAHMHAEGL
jgi:hypothetical protein